MKREKKTLAKSKQICNVRDAQTLCPWCKSSKAIVQNGIFHCARCSYEVDISQPHEIKVIGWTTGGDEDFLTFSCTNEDIYNAIVANLRENGYRFDWSSHQSDSLPCTPVINNGYKIYCGPRLWGHIMAEAHAEEADAECAYAEYAYSVLTDSVFPVKSVDWQQIIPFEISD